jgi:hypothetical protein
MNQRAENQCGVSYTCQNGSSVEQLKKLTKDSSLSSWALWRISESPSGRVCACTHVPVRVCVCFGKGNAEDNFELYKTVTDVYLIQI